MKNLILTPAYSLKDFRLLPGYTDETCSMNNISLSTRLCCQGDQYIFLDTPFVSAAMQAVTSVEMATALAELGGVGVLPVSDAIHSQSRKVNRVKQYKAGFQTDILTFSPDNRLSDVKETIDKTSYSIFPVTDTGVFHGKLMGVITDKDFHIQHDLNLRVSRRMKINVHTGIEVTDLKEANSLMIQYGHGFLPIVTREGTLMSVVFKKDLDKHISHPSATTDAKKRLRVGAAVSTHPEDRERIKELVLQEVDFLLIDSSDGNTLYQKNIITWIKKNFDVPVIAGNVVTGEGFQMLVNAGADAVKVGMGIGSGCTTQEAKATGRGQATAIIEVVKKRDAYSKTNRYIPIIADGGINTPSDIAVAIALGADTVMMGNFFARFAESPGMTCTINGNILKEYWMEGSLKAHNLKRYNQKKETFFQEGATGYVPFEGSIYDSLPISKQRLKATLSTIGTATIDDFHKKVILEIQSSAAQKDSEVHNMQTV